MTKLDIAAIQNGRFNEGIFNFPGDP